jgi:hypothetical protein
MAGQCSSPDSPGPDDQLPPSQQRNLDRLALALIIGLAAFLAWIYLTAA